MIVDAQYEMMIKTAAAEHAAAKEKYREHVARRVEAQEVLDQFAAEKAELRARLADFEAGIGDPMSATEFTDASYRVQWLTGAIKAQQKILSGLQNEEGAAGREIVSIRSQVEREIAKLLKVDFEETSAAVKAALKEALDGKADRPWPQAPKVKKTVEADRF